ncbi:MAG: geranylgeranyl reductase family protein [Candidatus Paceibacterota bacterium]|jgi:geranylgeranyl reductase
MESFEVVIIGAGPAGLSAAKKLAEAGKKVLLLEKNSVIGPKVCAGGFPSSVIGEFGLPKELWDLETYEMTFHTPLQEKTFKLGGPFYTVDRARLGAWQLEKLKGTSVQVRTDAKVTKVEKDHVMINGSEKIPYEHLIGADGANSVVRKYLGIKTENFSVAMQYIIPSDEYKKVEIYFDQRLISLGYVWIFPHKGYVSIGCGTEPRYYSTKKVAAGFEKWIKQNNIDTSKAKFEAFTINYDYRGHKFGNIYLAGDAAGLAAGLTGGGVYQALVSGEEVSRSICEKDYVSQRMPGVLKLNKKQNDALRFLEITRPILGLEMELFMLIIRNKWLGEKFINKIM